MKDADRSVAINKHTAQAQAQTKQKQTPTPPPLAPPPPPLSREHHKERSAKQQIEKLANANAASHDKNQAKSPGGNGANLASDINAATLEALNQMFWLPYLTQLLQMGQLTPDILKAMSPPNVAAMLQQQQQNPFAAGAQPFGLANGLPNLSNPLELAMWQQRIMEMNAQNVRETAQTKSMDDRLVAALRQQNLMQQQQQQAAQMQKSATSFFQNFQSNRSQSKTTPQTPAFLSPTPSEPQSRKSCNLQSPPLPKAALSNPLAQNPFFAAAAAANNFPNMAAMANLQKFGLMGAGAATESSNGSTTNALRKTRKEHVLQQQQQQQHLQALLLAQQQLQQQQHSQMNLAGMHHPSADSSSNKALMNLLQQQSNLDPHRGNARNDSTNKMPSIPSFDLTSLNANPSQSSATTSTSSSSSSYSRPHIRVKNGQHLLDPLAAQRRLLAANARCNELPEIGSTTNGMDQMLGNAGLLR